MFLKGSLTIIGIVYIQTVSCQFKDVSQLLDDLQKSYRKDVLPTMSANSYVVVKVYPAIVRINDLDADKGELSSTISLSLSWTDERLTWYPKDYGDVREVFMPASSIWLPDISVYNTLSSPEQIHDQLVEVTSLGHVLYVRNLHARSYCHVDLTWFPHDQHTCDLILSSWIYSSKKMLMEFMHVNTTSADIPILADTDPNIVNLNSHQWELLTRKARAEINLITYACCPDDSYIQLKIAITLKRNTPRIKHLTNMFILPLLLMTILVPFQYLLPHTSSSRPTFGLLLLFGQMLNLSAQCLQLPLYSSLPVTGVVNVICIVHAFCALIVSIITSVCYTNYRDMPSFLLKCMSKQHHKHSQVSNGENDDVDTNGASDDVIPSLFFIDKVLFVVFLVFSLIIVIYLLVVL